MMQKKKTLVYILHDIAIGGVEIALLSAIPTLTERYRLKVIVLGTIDQRLIENFSDEQKAVFQSFPYPLYSFPLRLKGMVEHILGLQPDYLVCSLWRAHLLGTLVKKKSKAIKFFSFIHSVTFFHRLDRTFSVWALKNADVVLTDSGSSYRFIQDGFQLSCPIRQVSFMTHAAPPYRERESPDKHSLIRFLFLGRLDKVKNLPAVVDVMHYLKGRGYQIQLDLYGRKENAYEELQLLIKERALEGNIHFKGEVHPDQKFPLFSQYHFYLQLSHVEGMAMSVAEAMQSGLPCVVSPVGEIPHYSQDMESAIFIDITDPAKWQSSLQKIEQAIEDPALYQKLSANSWSAFQGRSTYAESLIQNIEL